MARANCSRSHRPIVRQCTLESIQPRAGTTTEVVLGVLVVALERAGRNLGLGMTRVAAAAAAAAAATTTAAAAAAAAVA